MADGADLNVCMKVGLRLTWQYANELAFLWKVVVVDIGSISSNGRSMGVFLSSLLSIMHAPSGVCSATAHGFPCTAACYLLRLLSWQQSMPTMSNN